MVTNTHMKIAVVVSTCPPYRGGMGNMAVQHAAVLAAAGHQVEILAPGAGLRPILRVGNAALAPQLLWRLRGFDAVELHYPFYGGAEWVWLWKKLFGKRRRLAVAYHMDSVGKGFPAAVFRLYRALFLKPVLAAADRIIVTSRDYFSSSQAAAFAGDPRLREVPPAVDTDRFRPGEAGKENAAIFIGALDRAHYFKGVELLLEAFGTVAREIPESKLMIVGDGDLRETHERRASAIGLAGRVKFLGKVSERDLPAVYRSARFHVLPSVDRSEAFGLVTLEAAASGLPSIVSDLPGVRGTVEAGATGVVVPPGDSTKLAEAMRALFLDPAKTADMGHAARARAADHYSYATVDRLLVEAVAG